MATPTSRLKLKKQTLGSNLNQWGLSGGLNGVFDQVDVLAGYLEVDLGSATSYTFGTTNYATTGNEHMYRAVKFSGSPSSGVTVNIPAVDDFKFVENATGQTITFSNGATTATLANTFTGYIRTNGSSVITVLTLPDGVNVKTVADNIANVNLVAGQISPTNNISTLAAINAAISGVSAISTDVTAVNTDPLKSNIGTAAGAVTNINTVAGQISPTNNIATVAGADANITTVAGQISPTNNLGTVAGIASDVSTTAGANANITSVAGQISPTNNIGTVAGIASDISTTAGANANITSVAGQISPTNNIATVAGGTANIATVAGQISPTNNLGTVAGIASDVSTTAGVATSVTAYAKQYSSGSGDISTRGDGTGTVTEGDIRFRTDTDTMRVYTGSAWQDVAVTAGSFLQVTNNLSDLNNAATARTNLGGVITEISQDTTPQLGGDLDMGSHSISSGVLGIKNTGSQSELRLYCETGNAHFTSIKSAPHAQYSGNLVLQLPATVGAAGQTLTDIAGNGVLGWATPSSGSSFATQFKFS